jgi:hypothetical protein
MLTKYISIMKNKSEALKTKLYLPKCSILPIFLQVADFYPVDRPEGDGCPQGIKTKN